MDIEGEEIKATLGAKETIRANSPKLLIATYHEYENAMKISDILCENSKYMVWFSGCWKFEKPYRPYLTLAK